MRLRLLVAAGAAAVLAVPAAATAGSPPAPYLVTGGGQVLASADPSSQAGPGDTIAFVASLDERGNQSGSLQVVNTSEARDGQKPTIIFNGRVTCVEPGNTKNTATFGGEGRTDEGDVRTFTVEVIDNGKQGTDVVEFRFDKPCNDDKGTVLDGTTLARGEVKVDTANSGS